MSLTSLRRRIAWRLQRIAEELPLLPSIPTPRKIADWWRERRESGLQGQMTLAERFSSKASEAFRCNLELVGQFEGEGGYNSMAAIDTCGYFSTVGSTAQQHRGVVVVDASDRRRPQVAHVARMARHRRVTPRASARR